MRFGLLYEAQRPFQGTSVDWNTLSRVWTREKHREATITVEAALAEDGAVHSARAEAGSDQDLMASAAVNAVMLWRYEPARARGCAVPSVMKVRVTFSDR